MTDDQKSRPTLCEILSCRFPILQAGMGGVARADLVAAVIQAGGYGFLGMVRESPALIAKEIDTVRGLTDAPFGVNLISGATEPALFREELAVCLEKKVHSVCFFWGIDAEAIKTARKTGCRVLYQVGCVEEAREAEQAGADIIIAQGFEAGGHVRGTVSSLVLLPQVVKAVSVPVVGSGGFTSGQGLIAALALGAQGIHCGTQFLMTHESFAHDLHKEMIVAARSDETIHTDAFAINWPPHAPVRAIKSDATQKFEGTPLGHHPDDFPREVIAHEGDRPIYRYSTDSPLKNMTGALDSLALFAGQSAGLIEAVTGAQEVVSRIIREAEETLVTLGTYHDQHGWNHDDLA